MKQPPKKKVTLDMPIPIVKQIETLAVETNRSFAAMMRVLVMSGLEKF